MYKRQGLVSAITAVISSIYMLMSKDKLLRQLKKVVLAAFPLPRARRVLEAVSYTHLDVYKRQGPSNCLAKTQVCAKSKDDVYGLTPARCWKVKGTCASIEPKPQ